MIKNQNRSTATAIGGGAGGALAALVVLFMPDLAPSIQMTPEKASIATAALSTIFGFVVRYLPEPKN